MTSDGLTDKEREALATRYQQTVMRQPSDEDRAEFAAWIKVLEQWRSLPPAEQKRIRKQVTVDRVAASMAQECQPVSDAWIEQARERRQAIGDGGSALDG